MARGVYRIGIRSASCHPKIFLIFHLYIQQNKKNIYKNNNFRVKSYEKLSFFSASRSNFWYEIFRKIHETHRPTGAPFLKIEYKN